MPLENALFLHPLTHDQLARTSTSSSYAIRVTRGTTETLSLGPFTTDRYYWFSGDDQADASTYGGVGDLCAMLETCLNSHTTSETFTVTLSSTNRITITCTASFSILWGNAATTVNSLAFGFAQSDSSSVTTLTAANMTYGCCALEQPPTNDSRIRESLIGQTSITTSGYGRRSSFGSMARRRELSFALMPQEKALTEYAANTELRGSFEYLWLNALAAGLPVRYYSDDTSRTSTSYFLGYLDPSQTDDPLDRDGQYILEWAFTIKLLERAS